MRRDALVNKIKRLRGVSGRPMFGYECYSVNGKFFVGFSKKQGHEVILRLSKGESQKAVKSRGIKPFSHGAKAGWIEIDTRSAASGEVLAWMRKAYAHAGRLAGSKK